MEVFSLDDMVGGWFVGQFEPTVEHTDKFEVGIKRYIAGMADAEHLHKIATEITVIISGRARMAGRTIGAGAIVRLEPGETSDFVALEDTVLAVVKFPSVPSDKYIVEKS